MQCGEHKQAEAVDRVQDEIDQFATVLALDRDYLEACLDDHCEKMVCSWGKAVFERVIEAQVLHFEDSRPVFSGYTTGWLDRLKRLKEGLTVASENGAFAVESAVYKATKANSTLKKKSTVK